MSRKFFARRVQDRANDDDDDDDDDDDESNKKIWVAKSAPPHR